MFGNNILISTSFQKLKGTLIAAVVFLLILVIIAFIYNEKPSFTTTDITAKENIEVKNDVIIYGALILNDNSYNKLDGTVTAINAVNINGDKFMTSKLIIDNELILGNEDPISSFTDLVNIIAEVTIPDQIIATYINVGTINIKETTTTDKIIIDGIIYINNIPFYSFDGSIPPVGCEIITGIDVNSIVSSDDIICKQIFNIQNGYIKATNATTVKNKLTIGGGSNSIILTSSGELTVPTITMNDLSVIIVNKATTIDGVTSNTGQLFANSINGKMNTITCTSASVVARDLISTTNANTGSILVQNNLNASYMATGDYSVNGVLNIYGGLKINNYDYPQLYNSIDTITISNLSVSNSFNINCYNEDASIDDTLITKQIYYGSGLYQQANTEIINGGEYYNMDSYADYFNYYIDGIPIFQLHLSQNTNESTLAISNTLQCNGLICNNAILSEQFDINSITTNTLKTNEISVHRLIIPLGDAYDRIYTDLNNIKDIINSGSISDLNILGTETASDLSYIGGIYHAINCDTDLVIDGDLYVDTLYLSNSKNIINIQLQGSQNIYIPVNDFSNYEKIDTSTPNTTTYKHSIEIFLQYPYDGKYHVLTSFEDLSIDGDSTQSIYSFIHGLWTSATIINQNLFIINIYWTAINSNIYLLDNFGISFNVIWQATQ